MKQIAVVAGICLVLSAWCLDAAEGAARRRAVAPDRALKRKVDHHAVKASLGAALTDLGNQAGVKIRVEWSALEKAGVKREAKVSVDLKKVTYQQVLEVILSRASRSGRPLGWRIDGDGVVVSTHRHILLMKSGTRSRVPGLSPSRPAGAAPRRRRGSNYLPSVSFDKLPLRDALRFFQTVTGANFYINWKALQQGGIDADSPITLNIRKISIARAMDLTLDQINTGRSKYESVYWVIDRGVVLISTGNALNKRVVTKVVDASSTLMVVPDMVGPRIDLTASPVSDPMRDSSSSSEGIFDDDLDGGSGSGRRDKEDELAEKKKQRREDLVTVIKKMIGDDMWQPEGKGDVRLVGNNLVISQTLLGFKMLENALR